MKTENVSVTGQFGASQSSPLSETFTPQDAWDELVHKDDRTSPEEYPDHCLISFEELQDYMLRASKDDWFQKYVDANEALIELRAGLAQTPAVIEARLADAYAALRSIAEGNLGDASWQANYETIKQVARNALSNTSTVRGANNG